ncbi:MAG: alpha/beta hydrolase [Verrucomicrobiales bacterium]|nr:alpha/beta hydrolase [Verrucomicrobiales bacterium]HQZ27421.1 alpha/beta hydrolase [Verrucomicrobiales bacterium]
MPLDLPYVPDGHVRHVLDIYAPDGAKDLPVVFWIHGGGWQTGEKTMVESKPGWFKERGFVFVSINHRFLPEVTMEGLTSDVAKAFGWVKRNIAAHGGNPDRILVCGHSSGAQLAALICTDDRYLKSEGANFDCLIGCLPVDGDTYDIPAIIEVAETRRRVHHLAQATFGHREKFGNDPAKHVDFSAVTHVRAEKGIPPFLILYNAAHPDNSAQAARFGAVLKEAGVPVTLFAGKDTDHVKLNNDLGLPGDPATAELELFVETVVGKKSTTD